MTCGEFYISPVKKTNAAVILGHIAALQMRKSENACYSDFSNGTTKIVLSYASIWYGQRIN
jgi:hypothetical protein